MGTLFSKLCATHCADAYTLLGQMTFAPANESLWFTSLSLMPA